MQQAAGRPPRGTHLRRCARARLVVTAVHPAALRASSPTRHRQLTPPARRAPSPAPPPRRRAPARAARAAHPRAAEGLGLSVALSASPLAPPSPPNRLRRLSSHLVAHAVRPVRRPAARGRHGRSLPARRGVVPGAETRPCVPPAQPAAAAAAPRGVRARPARPRVAVRGGWARRRPDRASAPPCAPDTRRTLCFAPPLSRRTPDWDPPLYLVDGFLSAAECDALIAAAQGRLAPAHVVGRADGAPGGGWRRPRSFSLTLLLHPPTPPALTLPSGSPSLVSLSLPFFLSACLCRRVERLRLPTRHGAGTDVADVHRRQGRGAVAGRQGGGAAAEAARLCVARKGRPWRARHRT